MRANLQTDQELVQQYLSGHEASLEKLIQRHQDKVYTGIYMMVKDQYLAEDIFQETFIKVIDTMRSGKYNEEGKFAPWVMRISYNLCIDHFRKLKRLPGIVTGDGDDIFKFLRFDDAPQADHGETERVELRLRQLIDELPEEQKEVVMLRIYFNFSFREIAEYTQVSINTSLGRMRYALINLRKLMQHHRLEYRA
jgi:RNA polymerase sigma factor (sigma-70 family)